MYRCLEAHLFHNIFVVHRTFLLFLTVWERNMSCQFMKNQEHRSIFLTVRIVAGCSPPPSPSRIEPGWSWRSSTGASGHSLSLVFLTQLGIQSTIVPYSTIYHPFTFCYKYCTTVINLHVDETISSVRYYGILYM